VTLQEVETKLAELSGARGVWVNRKLVTPISNATIDGEEVVVIDVNGREFRLAPEDIRTLRRASADDCSEAGRLLASTR
jgi:hypothetical protein